MCGCVCIKLNLTNIEPKTKIMYHNHTFGVPHIWVYSTKRLKRLNVKDAHQAMVDILTVVQATPHTTSLPFQLLWPLRMYLLPKEILSARSSSLKIKWTNNSKNEELPQHRTWIAWTYARPQLLKHFENDKRWYKWSKPKSQTIIRYQYITSVQLQILLPLSILSQSKIIDPQQTTYPTHINNHTLLLHLTHLFPIFTHQLHQNTIKFINNYLPTPSQDHVPRTLKREPLPPTKHSKPKTH